MACRCGVRSTKFQCTVLLLSRAPKALNEDLVRQRSHEDGLVLLGRNKVTGLGGRGKALQVEGGALGLGLLLQLKVLLDALQEVVTALGVVHVLDADVDALLDVAVAHTLVHDEANGRLGHVVHDGRLSAKTLVPRRRTYRLCIHRYITGCMKRQEGQKRRKSSPSAISASRTKTHQQETFCDQYSLPLKCIVRFNSPVVELVRHALVDGAVHLDVDDIILRNSI